MRYLSLCSGIEAATQAWHSMGWSPVAFSEIEPFPSAVLAHHYPAVPNWGDMTRFKEWPDAAVDVLVGGTPCQSFSVAGLRKGLDDPRGNLALVYLAIAERYRPEWLVWENVPGVLSTDGGRAFGAILGAMAELGYGWAYRILDAQYVRTRRFRRAVPQRRRRVFVVAHLGDWRRAAAVLFDAESLRGNPPPGREAGEEVAGSLTAGTPFSRTGNERVEAEAVIPQVAGTIKACAGKSGTPNGAEEADRLIPAVANPLTHRMHKGINTTLDEGQTALPVAFSCKDYGADAGDSAPTLPEGPHDTANIRAASGGSSRSYVAAPMAVRRLTPVECERLQGFPDDFTRIEWRGKPAADCPDGPRCKALGNSMAVNAMEWIGNRIQMVQRIGGAAP